MKSSSTFGGTTSEFKQLERILGRRALYKFEELHDYFENTVLYKYLSNLILPLLKECCTVLEKLEAQRDLHQWDTAVVETSTIPEALDYLGGLEGFLDLLEELRRLSLANRFHQYRSQKVNKLYRYYLDYLLQEEQERVNQLQEQLQAAGWQGKTQKEQKQSQTHHESTFQSSPHAQGYSPEILAAFKTLELEPTRDTTLIKTAWKDLFAVWHPDKHQSENERRRLKAEQKAKAINHAYDILKKHFRF